MIKCIKCGKAVGEIDMEAKVKNAICDNCQVEKNNRKEPSYVFLNKRMIETTI